MGKRLRNDLSCVEWDVKPQLSQSVLHFSVMRLQCIADAGGSGQQQQLLLVATCHIHWDPDYSDVKLIQTMMLMNELKNIVEGATSLPSDVGVSSDSDDCRSCCADIPLILCGDFNSLPSSGKVPETLISLWTDIQTRSSQYSAPLLRQ